MQHKLILTKVIIHKAMPNYHLTSSSGWLRTSSKKECSIAALAVILFSGKQLSILASKSIMLFLSVTFLNNYLRLVFLKTPKESNRLASKGTFGLYSAIYSFVIDPIILKIAKSWSPYVFPLKMGVSKNNSAIMHPAAQTSIAVLYLVKQSISSGAL